jgi:hypothetical protein
MVKTDENSVFLCPEVYITDLLYIMILYINFNGS